MSRKPPKPKTARIPSDKLAAGLQKALEGKYGKVLEAAKRKWEREFGARKEASDDSVEVRVAKSAATRRSFGGKRRRGV